MTEREVSLKRLDDQIDNQVDNIKEKTTIIREYYHEIGQQAAQYTPTQVDSFFKARYNY